jgi:RimJ/RimL family protein N-acetyltransferase
MPFELQPHLTGSLVELRPLREEDFDALYAAASDPLIWEQHPESDRWTLPVFQRYFSGAIASGGAFLIRDAKTGEVIGSSRYHDLDEDKSEIEIGWTFLARSHWGGHYNRELKALMLAHAFQFVESVVFKVGVENYRSRRAVEKLGGVLVSTITDPRGRESVVYRLTPAEWVDGP